MDRKKCNSISTNKKETMILVYDTKQKDMPVYYGSYKEIAKYFNTTIPTIKSTISHKQLREKRYRLEREYIES